MATSSKELKMKLYIGGLPYSVDSDQLRDMLTPYGTVTSAQVITDRMTSTSRGFGFVEMSTTEEGRKAIAELDGTALQGRKLTVNEAKPREGGRDGGGGGRDGGGGN